MQYYSVTTLRQQHTATTTAGCRSSMVVINSNNNISNSSKNSNNNSNSSNNGNNGYRTFYEASSNTLWGFATSEIWGQALKERTARFGEGSALGLGLDIRLRVFQEFQNISEFSQSLFPEVPLRV